MTVPRGIKVGDTILGTRTLRMFEIEGINVHEERVFLVEVALGTRHYISFERLHTLTTWIKLNKLTRILFGIDK